MKHILKKLLLVIVVLLSSLLPTAPAYAAGGSISLTANRSKVAAGGIVIIAVYVNGGGNGVNAVQADLSYPAGQLQYVGFSASGSAFEIGATSGGGDGTATLARGTITPLNGSGLLGTVTFKALAASGSASIAVAASSSLVSDGNAVPYGSNGVTVSFGSVVAAAPGSSSKVATIAAPAPPKDTTAPAISAVKAIDVTPFSARITWTTNEPSDSAVDYGLDTNYELSASSSGATTAHSVVLNSGFLVPLTLLHYRIKSADGAGNTGTSPDQRLQLPGVAVTVLVRGPDGKPQANALVTLDGSTGTTDANGLVLLRSALGNKKVTTSYQGVTVQQPVTVAKSSQPLPPVQLDLSKQPLNHWVISTAGLLVLVLALLAFDAAMFRSRIFSWLADIRFAYPHRRAVGAAAVAAATSPLATPAVKHVSKQVVEPPTSEKTIFSEAALESVLAAPAVTETALPRPFDAVSLPPENDPALTVHLDQPLELAEVPAAQIKQIDVVHHAEQVDRNATQNLVNRFKPKTAPLTSPVTPVPNKTLQPKKHLKRSV